MEEAKKMRPREYIKIRGANEHNLKTLMWTFPEMNWWYSPVCPVPESLPWHLIRSMPKDRGVIWNLCPPTRDSSWGRWRNQT